MRAGSQPSHCRAEAFECSRQGSPVAPRQAARCGVSVRWRVGVECDPTSHWRSRHLSRSDRATLRRFPTLQPLPCANPRPYTPRPHESDSGQSDGHGTLLQLQIAGRAGCRRCGTRFITGTDERRVSAVRALPDRDARWPPGRIDLPSLRSGRSQAGLGRSNGHRRGRTDEPWTTPAARRNGYAAGRDAQRMWSCVRPR